MPSNQNHGNTNSSKERRIVMREHKILIHIADYLAQKRLITPEEKIRIQELIRNECK